MNRFLICLCFLFAGCGLYDFERAKSRKIMGNFYVANLHLSEYPGYIVIFKEKKGFEKTFLGINENVDYLKANDSVILVKTKPNPEVSFYFIKHHNGNSIISSTRVDENEFKQVERNAEFKTNYDSTSLQF